MKTKNILKIENGSLELYIDGKRLEHQTKFELKQDFKQGENAPNIVTVELFANFEEDEKNNVSEDE